MNLTPRSHNTLARRRLSAESLGVPTLLALSGIFFLAGCGQDAAAPLPPPAPNVIVTPVLQRSVPIYAEFVGQTESPQTVEIRARVEGFLEQINFTEGAEVTNGQLLFGIDASQYQVELEKAKALLQRDEATLMKARQDAKRFRSLHEKDAVSTSQFEKAIAGEKEVEATLASDRQAVEEARLKLSYTRMYAPLSGRIGRAQVRIGGLVGKGEPTLLATISKIDPIWVNASISEREYLQAVQHYQAKGVPKGSSPAMQIPITMVLADDSLYPHKGRINFLDRTVDSQTGTLPFRVEFPNPEKMVRPGQFSRLRAELDRRENALLVPQKAVQELQATFSVAVVGEDNKVTMRTVKPGERVGLLWVIEDGLKPGERIVVEGLQKVREGMMVTPTMVEVEDAQEPTASTPTGN